MDSFIQAERVLGAIDKRVGKAVQSIEAEINKTQYSAKFTTE
jgi:hypothetical protein